MTARLVEAPTEISGLTAAWLTAALQNNWRGVEVAELTIGPPIHGTATKISLRAKYTRAHHGLPQALVVKGGFAAHRLAMSYLYAHENRFYRDIAPSLGVNIPACLATVDDGGAEQHIAILEDLRARQVNFCRVETPLDLDQARGFLAILAKLHGRSWDTPAFASGGELADVKLWLPLPDPLSGGAYAHGQLVPQTWQRYMRLPRCLAVPRIFHDRERMQAGLEALNELSRTPPFCLLHADFHLGNLYFDADDTPGVLDWQSYSRGRWSHDVTYFLVSALDPPDRRRWESELVSFYLEKLCEHSVADAPSQDQAMAEYRLQIMDGLFYWMVNPPEWQSEDNNCAVAPRFALAAMDHRTFEAF